MNKDKPKMFNPKLRAARRVKLGENISIIRRRTGLSQAAAAELMGCSRYKFYRVEKGKADFSYIELMDLAQFFEVKVDEIIHLHKYSPDVFDE